jgi:YfiR/HmsC-like
MREYQIARAILAVLVGLTVISRAAAGEPAPESQTKSSFLINFAEFTEWPESVFANEKGRLIIGILGSDPFGKYLDRLVENDVLKGRSVRVLRYRKVEEIKTCHNLYVSKSEGRRLNRIVRALKERPVLIVSDIENSVARGVMIEMRTESRKIKLAINLESAKAAHLTLSSKLLRLGEIVEPAGK